ncbi:ATP-binding protein [Mesorhizobium sp.]|uniref:HD domain-containing protein n=1 Tax=Mesorhizobium sp. TaxID=1871066 RepID=UPI0025BA3D5B|nr:ATP-binding protein [Mesorhizobium sp.]
MSTAVSLMTDEAKLLISPEDAAVLSTSVALHDFGMHLTKEGFFTLISPSNPMVPCADFADLTWEQLWAAFYSEATRFDGRKLRRIFGNSFQPVRHPPDLNVAWEDSDYLLVGEFLRRNHPRLSHDIALFGMPAKDGRLIPICPMGTDNQRFLADLSGLVARSHGYDLRLCIDYLQRKYNNRTDPRRVRAVFLMVLLRIADYFQIQADRAPLARTDVVSFRSPLSTLEWSVHQSVRDINNTSGDPEAIFIDAKPDNVRSFLRLRSWLSDLQSELDKSWAVLGEVYGLQQHSGLNNLTVKIRRVRSNIDNILSFSDSVDYVPAQISFRADSPDLLNLLIEPLYGGDIGVGVRELLQNAVDAVREFDDLPLSQRNIPADERYQLGSDVSIKVVLNDDEQPDYFEIIDKGVGMNLDVISRYFLAAGASFRRSDEWRSLHEDGLGRSKVIRSGRFGVGALAAFLLGDEIEVTTRHVSAKPQEGFTFSATIDTEDIEIRRTTAPVGTHIRIKLSARAKKELTRSAFVDEVFFVEDNLGYFFAAYPTVSRFYGSKIVKVPERFRLPSETDGFGDGWRKLVTTDFTVFWTYKGYPLGHSYCNGILVSDTEEDIVWQFIDEKTGFMLPQISVYDRNGLLPIDLQRSKINIERASFLGGLWREVTRDLAAYAAVDAPYDLNNTWFSSPLRQIDAYLSYDRGGYGSVWAVSKNGFFPRNDFLVQQLKPRKLILGIGGQAGYEGWGEGLRRTIDDRTVLIQRESMVLSSGPRAKGAVRDWLAGRQEIAGCRISKFQLFLSDFTRLKLLSMSPGKKLRQSMEKLEYFDRDFGLWSQAPIDATQSFFVEALKEGRLDPKVLDFTMFVEADVAECEELEPPTPFGKDWKDTVPAIYIPFSQGRRRSSLVEMEERFPELVSINRMEVSAKKSSQSD